MVEIILNLIWKFDSVIQNILFLFNFKSVILLILNSNAYKFFYSFQYTRILIFNANGVNFSIVRCKRSICETFSRFVDQSWIGGKPKFESLSRAYDRHNVFRPFGQESTRRNHNLARRSNESASTVWLKSFMQTSSRLICCETFTGCHLHRIKESWK